MHTLVYGISSALAGLMGLADRLFWPGGLVLLCLLSAVVVLLIYRLVSSQRLIALTKSRMKAELLGTLLFKDSLRVALMAPGRVMVWMVGYVGASLVPLLVASVPMLLLMAAAEQRYGHSPLEVGQRTVLTARFAPGQAIQPITLETPPGLQVDAGPVRVPSRGEVSWRVVARRPGQHRLELRVGGGRLTKLVAVDSVPVSTKRHRQGVWQALLAPAEAPIADALPLVAVTVQHAPAEVSLVGWRAHWIVHFLVLTLVLALLFRRLFGVTF